MGWCRVCPFLGLSTVKYIREVSPLFKKPSLVADLPWDGVRPQSPSYSGSEDSGSPKHSSSSSSKDRKVISLKMCFISRNLTMPDLENRYAGQQQPTASCLNSASSFFFFLFHVKIQYWHGISKHLFVVHKLIDRLISHCRHFLFFNHYSL